MSWTYICLYYKADGGDQILVAVYGDHLLTGTSKKRAVQVFKLFATLQRKDVLAMNKFLGIRISRSFHGGYKIDQ